MPQLEKGITFAFVEFLLSGIPYRFSIQSVLTLPKITVRYVKADVV